MHKMSVKVKQHNSGIEQQARHLTIVTDNTDINSN